MIGKPARKDNKPIALQANPDDLAFNEGNRMSYCVSLFTKRLNPERLYKMSELQEMIKNDGLILKAILYNIIIPFDSLLDRYYLSEYLTKENIQR